MAAPTLSRRPERLTGLDAYRGFIMRAMASREFGFPQAASHFPDSAARRRPATAGSSTSSPGRRMNRSWITRAETRR